MSALGERAPSLRDGRVNSTAPLVVMLATFVALAAACARQDNLDRSALQLPVYPHATSVAVPASAKASGGHTIEVFTTWDSFDKVRDWYAATLPRGTQSVVNEVKRQATYALFDDRRRSVHLEVAGGEVYIYLSGSNATKR